MHTGRISVLTLLTSALAAVTFVPGLAQEPPAVDDDRSSEQVEESDEAFRRRMELEDARHRDPGFALPAASPEKKKEKIDTLPPASRDNIRDQLVDMVLENGKWEPRDAVEAYPYEPTEAARESPGLLQREQEAWDEQIEKYHAREAEAYHAQRSAAAASGRTGAEGGAEADTETGAEPGSGATSGNAGGASGDGARAEDAAEASASAGSYSPYAARRENDEDKPSTAGARQSALDFLRGRPAGATGAAVAVGTANESGAAAVNPEEADTDQADPNETSPAEPDPEEVTEIPGIIAIEDLDKLEGAEVGEEPNERDDPTPD